MNFCSHCASPVDFIIPEGDTLPRYVCPQCKIIHYQNPNIVVCSIPVWMENGITKIMLCRRAIEPRYDFWTLPGGFMENAETTLDAAERETLEEAGARLDHLSLHTLINLPFLHQVHLFYRAQLRDLDFHAGKESLEVKLFSEAEIPWDNLAFSTVTHAIRNFFDDANKNGGDFTLHSDLILEHNYDDEK